MTDIVTPPLIDELPAAPLPTDSEEAHDSKAYALVGAMVSMVPQINAAAASTEQNALAAQERAAAASDYKTAAQAAAAAASVSAESAAIIAGAQRWQPGEYSQGDVVWSPVSLLTYRRIPAGLTASVTDPSLDPGAWRLSGSPHSMPAQELSGPGPHQLVAGMHYLLLSADVVAIMPTRAFAQEQVRVTNLCGSPGPLLHGTFFGKEIDLRLDGAFDDRAFCFTRNWGWV